MTAPSGIPCERLVEFAPDAVLVVDSGGRVVLANRRAERMFGYCRAEFVGIPIETLALGPLRAECAELGEAARTSSVLDSDRRPLEAVGRRRDGAEILLEASLAAIATDEDMVTMLVLRHVIGRDAPSTAVEHQGRRQRQMLRAEQMMAIGQVAAGVAHELRNPLTSIKGLVQVNLREAEERGLPSDDLAVIEHEIRRMERTLKTFLDFARPPQLDRKRLNPASVVERVLALVGGRATKQQVEIRFHEPDAAVGIEADQDQIQQLLLNLVLNALDAMPHGGSIEIALRRAEDDYVELSVRDSGPGIAAHILPKIFETFVSSKETGVGLGLPVSKRIAEDHGGGLAAYNRPEGGACFVVRLPVSGPASGGAWAEIPVRS